MLKLEWDKEKNIVRIGRKEWHAVVGYKNSKAWAIDVLGSNGISVAAKAGYVGTLAEKNRLWNKAVGDALGCSYAVLYKHWKALIFKAFVGDDYPLIKKLTPYSKFRRGWDFYAVVVVKSHKDKLWQVYNDGLYNLLPVVAGMKASPKECKEMFKSAGLEKKWKTLANNSLKKNMTLFRNGGYFLGATTMFPILMSKWAVDTPTTLLTYFGAMDQDVSDYLKNNFKGKWSNKAIMMREKQLFVDTKAMAQREGEKFNPAWSPRRMHEEHDRLTKIEIARKYSPEPFAVLEDINPRVIEHKGFVATLLDNAAAIGEEGRVMHHCVGGYASLSQTGSYLVYSVTKDGERSSTIGIYKTTILENDIERVVWRGDQHYAAFNDLVKNEDEKEIGTVLVQQLNKMCPPESQSVVNREKG